MFLPIKHKRMMMHRLHRSASRCLGSFRTLRTLPEVKECFLTRKNELSKQVPHRGVTSLGSWDIHPSRDGIVRDFSSLELHDDFEPDEYEMESPYKAQVVEDGAAVIISFGEYTTSTFHAPWLWSNDPSWVHPTSGQRLRTPGQYPGTVIKTASVVKWSDEKRMNGEMVPLMPPPKGSFHPVGEIYATGNHVSSSDPFLLKVIWDSLKTNGLEVSYYHMGWLQQWRYDEDALCETRSKTRISKSVALQRDNDGIPKVNYKDLQSDEEEFSFQLLNVSAMSAATESSCQTFQ